MNNILINLNTNLCSINSLLQPTTPRCGLHIDSIRCSVVNDCNRVENDQGNRTDYLLLERISIWSTALLNITSRFLFSSRPKLDWLAENICNLCIPFEAFPRSHTTQRCPMFWFQNYKYLQRIAFEMFSRSHYAVITDLLIPILINIMERGRTTCCCNASIDRSISNQPVEKETKATTRCWPMVRPLTKR